MIQKVPVLVVDDNDIDVEAVKRAFRKQNIQHPIIRARDGVEALEILRDPAQAEQRPKLVLLDLNMPRMDGHEFLEELRRDPNLSDSVVFVLSTSRAERDVERAYRHHVAGYLVKSDIGDEFSRLISLVDLYSQLNEFPDDRSIEPR